MTSTEQERIRAAVREQYGAAAEAAQAGGAAVTTTEWVGSGRYDAADTEQLPGAAVDASLGCGNPTLLAQLAPGESVLDLGSGGGIDVLLSARRVAPDGKAIGLDMTPEMLELARRNQAEMGVPNAEFLQGTVEAIPLEDGAVDVIISNCVVNLSPAKDDVVQECFRVLRPGGRLAISDFVLTRPLPAHLRELIGLWTGCVAGALLDTDYATKLSAAGFVDVSVEPSHVFSRTDLADFAADLPGTTEIPADVDVEAVLDLLAGAVETAYVRARKPV